jgi:hypothetical protein
MPDVFNLAGLPALARLRSPEIAVAVADDADDALAATSARLDTIQQRVSIDTAVIDALDARSKLRRPVPLPPAVESLQSLVQRGRRRLERERQGSTRQLLSLRLTAVTQLRAVVEA